MRVHVFGAAGFAGAQLAALIDAHPTFSLGAVTARSDAGARIVDIYPEYRVTQTLIEPDVDVARPGDFAAVCYPHAAAADLVAELVDRGVRVVDVSADHRLRSPERYPEWYGFEHPRPDLLGEAVYGLPERYRDRIRDARLIANPGCFPEASLLALLPIADVVEDVVIDAKSGISGAGRTPTPDKHFSTLTENVWAYKVRTHRHTPEIAQELGQDVVFQPHVVPVDRGLLATAYARFREAMPGSQSELMDRYRAFYDGHPFVEVVDAPPAMRAVQRTNYAQVHAVLDAPRRRVVCLGVIDNLGKGAAGQALQNLNLMAGLDETEGLT